MWRPSRVSCVKQKSTESVVISRRFFLSPGPAGSRSRTGFLTILWLSAGMALFPAWMSAATASIDFNREVRPLLSENCFKCHGPDDGSRKAKLRFDLRDEALKPAKSGKSAIVLGAPDKSEF